MPENKQHLEAARMVYELFWESYLSGDIGTFASLLDEQLELIGTSESEIAHSKSEGLVLLEAQMHEVVGNVEKRNQRVSSVVIGDLILINELCDIYFRNEQQWDFYSRLRISTLLRETSEGWKVLQQHDSLPDHKVEGDETIALEKISKENIELRDAVKRRTVELENKNRELENEAALEKVRSSALAMKEPSDMVDVCNVISDQLQLMGISDIRNVQTAIINEHKGTYLNYQYFAAYDEGVIEETAYNHHPTVLAMVQEMKKSVNSTFKGSMAGKELSTFREWRKQYNQFPDPLLDEVESVHYYFYSIGQGGLGLSTYKPLSEEGHEIFKRFHNVFTLAYRRFTDIELALAQAREAQIEAAVERVRTQFMAMYQTSDLYKVNEEVLNQLYKLKVDGLTGVSIYLVDESDIVTIWDLSSPGNMSNPNSYSLKYDAKKYPVMGEWVKIWKSSNQDYFVFDFPKEKIIRAVEELKEIHPEMATNFKNAIDSGKLKHQWSPAGGLSDGLLSIDLMKPPSEDTKNIVLKIAGAFNMAYQRFLDLQKAEAQAREAQIELSLERTRSQVTAMQESSELLDIVVTMRNEFVNLGHEAHYFWHMRWLPEKYEKAMTSGDGTRIGMVMSLPRHIHGDIKLVADWEKSDEPSVVLAMDVETAVVYVNKMITLGDFEIVDHNAPTLDDIRHIGGLTFIMARTTHGEIGYSLPGVVPEPPKDALDTLVRFAGVFDLAYKRFEDLKAAERQTRMIREERDRLEIALKELKATQTQLIQSEKMASLGELTAGIAHEIQNPLNFVNNFSEVSKELIMEMNNELAIGNWKLAKEISEDIEQNLEKINHHGKRADAIVKGMLQHSRTSTGQIELIDINALADEYLRLSYHGLRAKDKSFNADFRTDFDPNLPKVNVIPQDIGRVLLNLINNAFYACAERGRGETPPGSKTPSGLDYKPTVTVSTNNLDDRIEISVKDNGNGIPEEIKNKIFQPFYTTKPSGQGTGLGLSLSYDLVKAHGGEIKVESLEGEGTEFIIQIPII